MSKQNGGIIGPDNVTTGGAFGTASGVFKLGEVTDLIRESKWPTEGPPTTVANSCRFTNGSSDNLTLSGSSGGSTTKFTRSFWLKKSRLGLQQYLMDNSGTTQIFFKLNADDTVTLGIFNSGAYSTELVGNANLMRDPSAWYHIVIAVDYTNATQAYRARIYINNSEVTSFSTSTRPGNTTTTFDTFNSSKTHYISGNSGGSHCFGGYLAEVVHIDGQQLTPSSFAETNSDSGIWVPKPITGLNFGTKGFYLDFEDSSALGNDVSGNNLDYTANNLTSVDQSTDTPNNNFCVQNSAATSISGAPSFTSGNLTIGSGSGWKTTIGTFALTSGKWYWENKGSGSAGTLIYGIASTAVIDAGGASSGLNNDATIGVNLPAYGYHGSSGSMYYSNTSGNGQGRSSWGTAYNSGDLISIYLDLDNNKLYMAKNDALQVSGVGYDIQAGYSYYPMTVPYDNTLNMNYGIGSFGATAVTSAVADTQGFGAFEYSPNRGGAAVFDGEAKNFLALCTNNLNSI